MASFDNNEIPIGRLSASSATFFLDDERNKPQTFTEMKEWNWIRDVLWNLGFIYKSQKVSDIGIYPDRRIYAHVIAKACNLLQEDYATRLSVVGNQGRHVCEGVCALFAPVEGYTNRATLYEQIEILKTRAGFNLETIGHMHILREMGNNADHVHLEIRAQDKPKVVDSVFFLVRAVYTHFRNTYPEDSERAVGWANRFSPVLLYLDSIGLKKYHYNFMRSGFNTLDLFLDMRNDLVRDPTSIDLDLDDVAMARGHRRTFRMMLPDLTDEQAAIFIATAKQVRENRVEREREEAEMRRVQQEKDRIRQEEEAQRQRVRQEQDRIRREEEEVERQRAQQERERIRQEEEAEMRRVQKERGRIRREEEAERRRVQEFQKAVNLWCSDPAAAESLYGHISTWDTSAVTSMEGLFRGRNNFNEDISGWDVSNVTDLSSMFYRAYAFNQPLGGWNVSNVTNMSYMFDGAYAFNQPLGAWDVSNVTNMQQVFNGARTFNQPLGAWDVSNVTSMNWMFRDAWAFNQPLGGWNVSNVTDMSNMFCIASAFNQPLGAWNVSNVTAMSNMFDRASAFNQSKPSFIRR